MPTSTYLESVRWSPGIGDPTIIGWITVAVYFIVALICLKAAFVSKPDKSIKAFWLFLTFFLITLGINKQLDLQTLLTLIGKYLAIEQGWYKDRRAIQVGFIIFIGIVGFIGLTILYKKYKSINSAIKIALTGCVILFVFIFIRASSFHHIELLMNINLSNKIINLLLELSGLSIIGLAGVGYISNFKPPQ